MSQKNSEFSKYDKEAAKILDGFLPHRIIDAHCHPDDFSKYLSDTAPLFGNRQRSVNMIPMPKAEMADPVTGKATEALSASTENIRLQLAKHPEICGEIMAAPGDTAEDIEKRILSAGKERVIGIKPYHLLSVKKPTMQAEAEEYTPECVWEAAQKHKLAITMHLVKDASLSDPSNLSYVIDHAKRYPDAKLILAHCARSFAAWTGIESIDKICSIDNIWYDFSAICESPQMFMLLKKAGVSKCMWGSDYPISLLAGKAISLAGGFYWINERDLSVFAEGGEFESWLIETENLMAVRQAFKMLDLKEDSVERFFSGTAHELFGI